MHGNFVHYYNNWGWGYHPAVRSGNWKLTFEVEDTETDTTDENKEKKRTEEEKYILTFSFQKLLHLKCIYQPLAVTQKKASNEHF